MARKRSGSIIYSPRQWGHRYLLIGLSGLALLYVGGLIPFIQHYISHIETGVFFHLNKIMGRNPVWDWTIMVTASDVWVSLIYLLGALLLLGCGWRMRKEDYGAVFGYIVLTLLVVIVAEEFADWVASGLHRILPWKDGVLAQIKKEYGVGFIKMHKKEGLIDDSATALFCLYFLARIRFPRAAAAILFMLALYVVSNLIAGTQWLCVQLSSALIGAVAAGLALSYLTKITRYLERKSSQIFVLLLGELLVSRKLLERPLAKASSRSFWRMILAKRQELSLGGYNRFWHDVVERQAVALLGADPAGCELFKNPNLSQERVKSSGRVRFLRTENGELHVLRATRQWGGVLRKSPHFISFTESVKNNISLQRLGFPVPRVMWTQEGITAWGLKNYFFAIEEFMPGRPLDQAAPDELIKAMTLLARLHRDTATRWGGLHDERPHSRTLYVLGYLRGEIYTHLKRIDDLFKLHLSDGDLNRIWKLFESAAVDLFGNHAPLFRLIHGDASPNNLRLAPDGEVYLIDFPTVRHDLAGWEIIKAPISLTRKVPAHCPLVWDAYFEAAGEACWTEFLSEAKLAFARFALRELTHRRVQLKIRPGATRPTRKAVLAWLDDLFTLDGSLWGSTPGDTDWARIFAILGLSAPVEGFRADAQRIA